MKIICKISAVFALMLWVSTGCRKEKNDPPKQIATLLLKSITTNEVNTYEYDNNNRLVKQHESNPSTPALNNSTSYSYNGQGQLLEKRTKPDDPGSAEVDELVVRYTYNGGGLLETATTVYINDGVETLASKETAAYAADKISIHRTSDLGNTYLQRELTLDANKNLKMLKTYRSTGALQQTSEYTFDNNPSNTSSLPARDFYKNSNNYVSLEVKEDGVVISEGSYAYEYNEDGYPIKRTTNTGAITTYEYIKK